jgi:hypothetical protein
MEVLQLDMSGRPQSWISAREAAILYASDGVAWTLGQAFYVLRGGTQRRTGLQSRIEVHPIIAVRGSVPSRAWRRTPRSATRSCSHATARSARTAAGVSTSTR